MFRVYCAREGMSPDSFPPVRMSGDDGFFRGEKLKAMTMPVAGSCLTEVAALFCRCGTGVDNLFGFLGVRYHIYTAHEGYKQRLFPYA